MRISDSVHNYCHSHGYKVLSAIPQDASPRQYYHIQNDERAAILMSYDPYAEQIEHRTNDFLKVGEWLQNVDINTPDIYHADKEKGFLILESFGQIDFKKAMNNGADKSEIYNLAHDVLKHLQKQKPPVFLQNYFKSTIHAGHRQIIDYYVPAIRKQKNPDGLIDRYLSIWNNIEKELPEPQNGFMHIDYHVENLMLVDSEQGLRRCGVIDFQTAHYGPIAYDLVNLLEDARFDIPKQIQGDILETYDDSFKQWYRVLGTQFHSRVLGLFIKLPLEQGKTKYLEHIPRLCTYIANGLKHTLLKPLKDFYDTLGIDFNDIPDFNEDNIQNVSQYIEKDK